MEKPVISDKILYVGVDDNDLDLFESQYMLEEGVSYNSYIIMDEKIAIMDSVDIRGKDAWLKNVEEALAGKKPDYIVVSHMEPDHGANLQNIIEKYPEMQIVGNAKTFTMMNQFFPNLDTTGKQVVVKEGDTLSLGEHTLKFIMAPMVHWPEVMVSYEEKEGILFSADAFGKFGSLGLTKDEEWACEARRYYFNIVGKYGAQVQALLKKAATLDIKKICALHGPILDENLDYYIGLYDTWSKYDPEEEGIFIAYASVYGNTGEAAKKLGELLEKKGAKKVVISDLSREDIAECVEDAFRYDKLVVAASTYDGGIFPPMHEFISHLKSKNYQKRKVGFIENGTWAPQSAKLMRAMFEEMKNMTLCENTLSIKSTLKDSDMEAMEKLADEILQ